MTTPLSPAAQAVLDALYEGWAVLHEWTPAKCLAAALRTCCNDWRIDTEFIDGVEYIRITTLERIAAELEGHQ